MTHNHAVCYPGEERDVVIVCLREPCGCGYFIRRPPQLWHVCLPISAFASCGPICSGQPPACPAPILFVPVGPAGHPGTVAGSGQKNPHRMVFSLKTNLADWSGLTAEGRLGELSGPTWRWSFIFARR